MVRVETEEYKMIHGKAPRGFGEWVFKIGNDNVSLTGMYRDTKREAKRLAKFYGFTSVKVLG